MVETRGRPPRMTRREPGMEPAPGMTRRGGIQRPGRGRGKTRKMRRDHLEGLTARWAEAA